MKGYCLFIFIAGLAVGTGIGVFAELEPAIPQLIIFFLWLITAVIGICFADKAAKSDKDGRP